MSIEAVNTKMILVPIVVGKNRIRGNAEGAMVDDENGELQLLRSTLAEAAKNRGVEPTMDWLNTTVVTVLRIYENELATWAKKKGGTVGFVQEFALPNGSSLVMADRRVLAKIPSSHLSTSMH